MPGADFLGRTFRERYFTAALLLFIASFLVFPTSKSVNNFYYVFLGLPALFYLIRERGRLVRMNSLTAGWLSLVLFLAVIGAAQGAGRFLGDLLAVAVFMAALQSLVSVELLRDDRLARALFWVLALYVVGVAVLYATTGRYQPGERILEFPGGLKGPIFSSMWLVCLYGLAAPAWVSRRQWLEAGLALAVALLGVGFVLQSRSGLAGIAVLAVVGLIYVLRWGKKKALVAFTIVLVFGLAAGYLLGDNEVLLSLVSRGDSYRLEIWRGYILRWMECGIWLGCGAAGTQGIVLADGYEITHMHNLYLGLLLHAGLGALVLFLGVMCATLWAAWRARDPWGLYLLLALVMLNFDGNRLINDPNEVWLLVLLPAGLIAAGYCRGDGVKPAT